MLGLGTDGERSPQPCRWGRVGGGKQCHPSRSYNFQTPETPGPCGLTAPSPLGSLGIPLGEPLSSPVQKWDMQIPREAAGGSEGRWILRRSQWRGSERCSQCL